MTRSFQAPERIGAREQELTELEAARDVVGASRHMSLEEARAKFPGTTDHDGDGKMGGVKGRKPKAKKK
jgi:hypothetical protein